MKVQVVFALALLAMVSTVSSMAAQQTYCGRRLAVALAMMCPEEEMGKRSRNIIPNYEVNYWPLMTKGRALEGFRGKRQGTGVASECCDKPCALSELLSYC